MSESRLEKADLAAAKALDLGIDQPEVHLSLGYYYLYGYRDRKSMNEHWEIAERGIPHNIDILKAKAAILGTQGRWEEHIEVLKEASILSPFDGSVFAELAMGLWLTRQYKDALDACNQAIILNPDDIWPYIYKWYTLISQEGPNKQSRDVLKLMNKKSQFYNIYIYNQEIYEGNFQAALEVMSDTSNIWGSKNKMWVIPKTIYSALIYDYLNDNECAQRNYRIGLKILQKEVKLDPENPSIHSSLGIALAGIGQKEEAIKEGKKAVELLPMSKDGLYGITYVLDLTYIYTMVGEFDLALEQLEFLLSVPSFISVEYLVLDIRYAPLKTHPEYKKLLSKYAVEE